LRLKGGKEQETLGLHRTGCVQVNLWAGCVGVTLEMKKVHEGAPLLEGGFLFSQATEGCGYPTREAGWLPL
jgi:hypothetical protein